MGIYLARMPDQHGELVAKVSDGVLVRPSGGVYTKPTTGVPIYVLPAGESDASALPTDWRWAISDQQFMDSPELGVVSGTPLAGPVWTETDAGGNSNAGLVPFVEPSGVINHTVQVPITYGRSETCWYDGINHFNFRPVSGDRFKISLDFKGSYIAPLIYANSNSWFSVHQYLGPTIDNSWPHAPFSVIIEKGEIKLKGQPGSVYLYGTATLPYADDRWYRYEEEILLGGTETGTVSVWIDGQPLCVDYKPMLNAATPGYGTYYEGSGNASFDYRFVYFKSGNYCGRDSVLANDDSVVWTRNRRMTWTKISDGNTTTWREAPAMGGGYHLFWRNITTGIISPVLDQ